MSEMVGAGKTDWAVMTYNILVGGKDMGLVTGRLGLIAQVIEACRPDIVGIQEANDPDALQRLADQVGMIPIVGTARSGFHVGLLSRWPVREWRLHPAPGHPAQAIFQKALLEATIDLPGEPEPWHIFVAHLTADFHKGWWAERRRVAEIASIIEVMAEVRAQGLPHLLMGDFNSLAPGERFNLVRLIARVVELDDIRLREQRALPGQPHLGYLVPRPLRPLLPAIRRIPTTPWLAGAVNFAANLAFPRFVYPTLKRAGYVECLRQAIGDPRAIPPTCPLPLPAGRIDYIWASPDIAARLRGCEVVADAPDRPVLLASDHAPILARFAPVIAPPISASDTVAFAGAAQE